MMPMRSQKEYVEDCLNYYSRNDIRPGDPSEGFWNNAHYPAPKGFGDETIPLLFEHHQVQGLLQSEEYGKCCFWVGDAKDFLVNGPFVEDWFYLWDLYEKWSSARAKEAVAKAHSCKDPSGKSLLGVKNGKKASVRMNQVLHSKKDSLGRSVVGVKASLRLHSERDSSGKSIRGKNLAQNTNKQQWMCTVTGYIANPGALTNYQRAKGIDKKKRVRVS